MRKSSLVIISLLSALACDNQPPPLRLAVMMPLSVVSPPRTSLPNIEWAKETVNAAGGINGRQLAVDYYDTKPDNLTTVAQQLAADPQYPAVIGPGTSEMLLAVADTFVRYRKPLVSFTSTSAEVLRAYGRGGVIWRTRQSDIVQTEVMLRHAKEQGATRLALITTTDSNGSTFFDWFSFLATESGYSADAIDIETIGDQTSCDTAVENALATKPDMLLVAASTTSQQMCVLRATAMTSTKVLFADTGLDPLALLPQMMQMPQPLPALEGFGGSASPMFAAAYRARNNEPAQPVAASEYDTVLLLAYGLALSQGQGGDTLIESLKRVVSGSGPEEYGWDEKGVAMAMAAIGAGRLPKLQGASASLVFDPVLYTDLKSASFGHWKMTQQGVVTDETYDTSQPGYLTSQGALVLPGLASISSTTGTSAYTPVGSKTDSWALIAALSSGWPNYRHQADALRQYQILRANGVPDDHIILILDDGIATSAQNPRPGVVVNQPGGPNLHQNLQIDYDLTVTAQDVADILTGNVSVRTPKVIATTQESDLYVYLVGHGGKQGLSIGATTAEDGLAGVAPLSPATIRQALCTLRSANRLRRGLVVVESCYAGVFGDARYGGVEGLCDLASGAQLTGVALMTAANNNEVSFAADYDSALGTWVSDAFSSRYAGLVAGMPSLDIISLYTQVYVGVAGSHAGLYNSSAAGNLGSVQASEFLAP